MRESSLRKSLEDSIQNRRQREFNRVQPVRVGWQRDAVFQRRLVQLSSKTRLVLCSQARHQNVAVADDYARSSASVCEHIASTFAVFASVDRKIKMKLVA